MKKLIINYAKRHHWFMNIIRKLRTIYHKIIYIFYFITNGVDDNIIIFESFMGRSYSDSPKAIYEYLIKNKKYNNYKFIWFFKNPEKYKNLEKNKNTIVLKYNSKLYFKYYSKSKYWITNSRIPDSIIKKNNQIYVQCWHGTPLKKLGFDITVEGGNAMNSINDIRKKYTTDAKKYSYMISPSKFCTEKFISAFNLKKLNKEDILLEVGYPRNDFLINHKASDINRIKKQLKLPSGKKIILYAPTWRDNQHQSNVGYTYKTEVDFDYLKDNLSDEYIILFRAHYFVANSFDFDKYKDFVYDVSKYDDINDLYIISDILITDYSSVFFDYSILKRPIIFYMYDLEEYQNKLRDFYIDLKELPGNIVQEEKELIKEIKKSKNFKYDKKYKFFNDKFTYLEDGKASERVVKKILKDRKYKYENK